ncbi:S8 family serine peptidase [Aquimarina sp. 2304DJ70-9]|uniref:S8 family serine peptidase n=1 Tax=Aquimarina penaris TaxID=3231044 RepID=UPI003462F205
MNNTQISLHLTLIINTIIPINIMKNLKFFLIFILCLLFQLPIFGQQNKSTSNTIGEPYNQYRDDDDDEEDDEDDEDEDIIKHPSLYFVTLDPTITQAEVDILLDELNSEEIWHRPEINLRLWNTVSFPYISAQGQTVTNIDGQVQGAQGKTDVDGVEFNIGHIVPTQPMDIQGLCFDTIVPQYATGTNPIKISIFDTGITQVSGNSPGYAFSIPQYTGYDYIDDDEIPEDLNGHGTHIAGLIHHLLSAQGSTSAVSFDIRKTHDDLGRGFISNLIPAILDAVNEGANILNFSFSYQNRNVNPTGRPLKLAVDYAEQMGAMVIAAAGNTNENNDTDAIISFPASYPNANILSVASISCKDNKLSNFSSYGQYSVDVALLGENIPGPGLNGNVVYQSGTSFASANVTALATILATHQTTFDYQNIKCSFINTSTVSSDFFEKVVANGIINFSAAFNQLSNGCTTRINKSIGAITPEPKFMFYPNPFNETLQLEIDENIEKEVTVSIFNQTGILVLQKQYIPERSGNIINVTQTQQLAPGTYFVKVDTKNNTRTQIVVKR